MSRTRGSARQDRARETPIQIESRVRGSECIIDSKESAQPGAAFGLLDRIATASAADDGERVQPNSSRGVRLSSAAAWSRAWSAVRVLPSQNPPDSTPPVDRPVAEARPVARIIAVSGSSHPRTGDQRNPDGRPSARRCGSNTATGPRSLRAVRVAAMLSGLVAVVMTAPGASRIALMTT